jgi:hypothetical protein
MAQYGLDFFAEFHKVMGVDGNSADIGFKRRGYLFISDDGDHARMEANHHRQVSLGAQVDLLDRDALKARFPSLNVSDVALAVHSPDDAWINPHAALMRFRDQARSLGVVYVEDRVVDWRAAGGLARDVALASGAILAADSFVLAAGAWSGEIGAMIGLTLPVEPMCRESHYFVTNNEIEPLPFIKTETHLAFGPESGRVSPIACRPWRSSNCGAAGSAITPATGSISPPSSVSGRAVSRTSIWPAVIRATASCTRRGAAWLWQSSSWKGGTGPSTYRPSATVA